MTPQQLLDKLRELINNKKTHPKFITFAELRRELPANDQTRESFKILVANRKIKVRRGINQNMIEVL